MFAYLHISCTIEAKTSHISISVSMSICNAQERGFHGTKFKYTLPKSYLIYPGLLFLFFPHLKMAVVCIMFSFLHFMDGWNLMKLYSLYTKLADVARSVTQAYCCLNGFHYFKDAAVCMISLPHKIMFQEF